MRIMHRGFYFQSPMILQMDPEEYKNIIESDQNYQEIIRETCHEDGGDFLRFYLLFERRIAVVIEVREARKK